MAVKHLYSSPIYPPIAMQKTKVVLNIRTYYKPILSLLRSGRRHGLASGVLDSAGHSGRLAFADVALGGRDGVLASVLGPGGLLGPLGILPC
jgi:hypothetical protein